MTEKESIWEFLKDEISNNSKAALVIVGEASNHSPGRQGFKMAVSIFGNTFGTIGGGIMEKTIIAETKEMLAKDSASIVRKLHHFSNTEKEQSGLICGGFQTVIVQILNETNIQDIEEIIKSSNKIENGLLILESGQIKYLPAANDFFEIDFSFNEPGEWIYKENIGMPNLCYIAGGGHVGLAVSRIMKSLGFYITIFDYRKDIFTMEQNTFADSKIITDYENIGEHIIESPRTYVVIVTPQHFGDRAAIGSVINKKVKYIGMMGSKKKIKTVFDALIEEGVTEMDLKRVHTPIGLKIGAETPEEIAISIAAEIIKIKSEN